MFVGVLFVSMWPRICLCRIHVLKGAGGDLCVQNTCLKGAGGNLCVQNTCIEGSRW